MADIASISAVLSSIKTATDLARIIKDSSTSLEQAEIKFKISELVGALAEAKLEIADIQNLLLEKDQTISGLKAQIDLTENVFYENRCYWTGKQDEKDGPFCQRCFDVSKKLIRLQLRNSTFNGRTRSWQRCLECKGEYEA